MGSESQASAPSARRRSVMLFRRARTVMGALIIFWLWMLLGSAGFVASLFDRPFYAMLALYALGTLTLISLLIAPVALAYLLMNRPGKTTAQQTASQQAPAQPQRPAQTQRFETARPVQPQRSVRADLAPVIRMIPRKVKDSSASLGNRAAAKWRDLAS
ncbi:hypothetical protein ITX31_09530 [Arthrobacter gandavensis]|uniref:hypothetical protein n=1 Tax=Arthrobacter gandavensis TaxID=169960 RepID=UPI00188FD273|nr:hypothetical protein [Arthrobacter gandavensis]MBF4994352.1 hypothetical protein [Arthrobacter gandavensis]